MRRCCRVEIVGVAGLVIALSLSIQPGAKACHRLLDLRRRPCQGEPQPARSAETASRCEKHPCLLRQTAQEETICAAGVPPIEQQVEAGCRPNIGNTDAIEGGEGCSPSLRHQLSRLLTRG